MVKSCLVIFFEFAPEHSNTVCTGVNESSCKITPEQCEKEEVVLREAVPQR